MAECDSQRKQKIALERTPENPNPFGFSTGRSWEGGERW
jgi:hypothetical protein